MPQPPLVLLDDSGRVQNYTCLVLVGRASPPQVPYVVLASNPVYFLRWCPESLKQLCASSTYLPFRVHSRQSPPSPS